MYKEFNLENVKEVYGRLKTLTEDYNYKNFEVAFLIMERLGNIEDGEQITENLIKKVEEIAENSESLVSDYCIEELEKIDEELEENIENIEKAIEEIEKEIEYEKKKQDICGYGSGDMAYLMELEEKLEELQEKLEEL